MSRNTLLVSVLIAATLFTAFDADAQSRRRRRAVAFPNSPSTGGGDCIEYKPVRVGMKASYLVTSNQGNVTYTVTYLADSPTETRTTQKVTTPQATADAETRLTFETVPGANFDLRALKHLYTKVTTPVPIIGSTSVETDIDFVPSLVLGPITGWCAGTKWSVPATTETITARSIGGTFVTTQTTIATEGEVLAVNVPVTVPGGTYNCIKLKTYLVSNGEAQVAIAYNSIDHAITIKQESLDNNGNVTSTTVLTGLQ